MIQAARRWLIMGAVCAIGASGAWAQAPEGFRACESKAKGIAVFVPIDFDELPVPPTEDLIQMKFAEKANSNNKDRFRSEIWIVAIPKGDVKTGESPASAPAAKPDGAKGDDDEDGPKPKGRKPIQNFPEFVKHRLANWKDPKADGKAESMYEKKQLDRFALTPKDGKMRGYAWVMDDGDQTVAVISIAEEKAMEDWIKKFERTARSLKLKESSDALSRDVELHYKLHPFRNVDYRKEVRRNLAAGWSAEDTENFILICHTKDQMLLSKLKNDLEVCRTKYIEIFPPTKTIDAVSTVRVCKDKEEFQKFAGTPDSVAGFWNVQTKELVFYDAVTDSQNSQKGRADSIIVLYHEAFHQYIYYACGEVAPHSWFNEGFGDYFSGCQIGGGGRRVDRIGVNTWRIPAIKAGFKVGRSSLEENPNFKQILSSGRLDPIPYKNLVKYSQPEYYNPAHVHMCYAQGWALIYFLRESKAAKANAKWNSIIPTYFKTLVGTFTDEIGKAGENPSAGAKAGIQEKSRQAAVEAAYKDWSDGDFDKLEASMREFYTGIADPNSKK